MNATHILKGQGQLNWAYFEPSKSSQSIQVCALLGAVNYIDASMDTEQARAQYRQLRAQGWKTPAELGLAEKDIMSLHVLRLHLYD